MCGIFAAFNLRGDKSSTRKLVAKLLKRIAHRGPDSTGVAHYETNENLHSYICHQRLSIVDPLQGEQPIFGSSKDICAVVNGEIYNHMEIRATLSSDIKWRGHSDCLVVPHMYEAMEVKKLANILSGKFGAIVYDHKKNKFVVIRDHIGIIPVYIGKGKNGEFFVCSEMKAFHDEAANIQILLPGHYYDSELDKQVKWYEPLHYDMSLVPESKVDLGKLRDLLVQAVERRLMADVPFGVLLSGGLDSSIIASITARLYENYQKKHLDSDACFKTLHSFCVGLEGSPDLKASREVANFLKTKHHEFTFTVEEGIDAISDVIYHTETFNPTTIRASTPMYLMARKIKSMGIKMVLTGEGSDEIFGGYLYFHKAPNKKEFHEENIRKLNDLYKYDLLRANKSLSAWGIEGRVPFLDKDFVEYAMSIDPECKLINEGHKNIEKWVIRKAFDCTENPYLPENVLWRQKEQFSDGVGYNWIDGLKVNSLNNFRNS